MGHIIVKYVLPELIEEECEKQKRTLSIKGLSLLLLVNCSPFHVV